MSQKYSDYTLKIYSKTCKILSPNICNANNITSYDFF